MENKVWISNEDSDLDLVSGYFCFYENELIRLERGWAVEG